jgi:hypothetical protein
LYSKGIPRFRDKDNHKTTALKVWERELCKRARGREREGRREKERKVISFEE